ncbi:hypothetical protein ElyMa_000533200 [Elysia marginata]|uniref:Uncharacterized protein n=1 Tax=Elysia marginata TaxID=1093978 RepID=A0AAV4G0F3_9GAST|nr:hypothetical protein ElyMa_000533200 [Elysia marginata]
MNAAVSKLQKDIWKNESDGKKENKEDIAKITKATNKKDQDNNSLPPKTKPKKSQEAKAETKPKEDVSVLHYLTEGELMPPLEMEMEQTAVSQIRRSIFHLPKSSPYTEYYPPEKEKLGEKTTGPVQTSAFDTVLSKEKTNQPGRSKSAGNPKENKQSNATSNGPRSKALARRQDSKGTMKAEEDNRKEHRDKQSKGKENDEKVTDVTSGSEKKELQRMKGVFFCEKCQKRWKSLHVYCEPGTKKANRYAVAPLFSISINGSEEHTAKCF